MVRVPGVLPPPARSKVPLSLRVMAAYWVVADRPSPVCVGTLLWPANDRVPCCTITLRCVVPKGTRKLLLPVIDRLPGPNLVNVAAVMLPDSVAVDTEAPPGLAT